MLPVLRSHAALLLLLLHSFAWRTAKTQAVATEGVATIRVDALFGGLFLLLEGRRGAATAEPAFARS